MSLNGYCASTVARRSVQQSLPQQTAEAAPQFIKDKRFPNSWAIPKNPKTRREIKANLRVSSPRNVPAAFQSFSSSYLSKQFLSEEISISPEPPMIQLFSRMVMHFECNLQLKKRARPRLWEHQPQLASATRTL